MCNISAELAVTVVPPILGTGCLFISVCPINHAFDSRYLFVGIVKVIG